MKAIFRYLLPMLMLTSLTSCEDLANARDEVLKETLIRALYPYYGWHKDVYVSCEVTCPEQGWKQKLFEANGYFYEPKDPHHYYRSDDNSVHLYHSLTNPTIEEPFEVSFSVDRHGADIEIGKRYPANLCSGLIRYPSDVDTLTTSSGATIVEIITHGIGYDEPIDGWVEFEKCGQFSTTRHWVVSGQFEFSAKNEEPPYDVVEVKKGVFKDVIVVCWW